GARRLPGVDRALSRLATRHARLSPRAQGLDALLEAPPGRIAHRGGRHPRPRPARQRRLPRRTPGAKERMVGVETGDPRTGLPLDERAHRGRLAGALPETVR